MGKKPNIEHAFERALFSSRWLMAPMYLCLVISLAMLTIIFIRETMQILPNVFNMTADEGILSILTLIDMSLAANLMLIVIFSGYENFVSKLDLHGVCQTSCPPISCGVSDFGGAVVAFRVQPDGSGWQPVARFS